VKQVPGSVSATTLNRIPVQRLRPLIEGWLRSGDGTRTLRSLEAACGVNERVLGAIMRGEREHATFGIADRILTHGLGGPWLWLLPPPDGLSDLYIEGDGSSKEEAE
jgi:hypothetical protein